ncbi:undecaprenyl-phosphate glucose phosphotransferase [candidate division KSB1 bacterium 4484_87]|nr:MAG: undecaprenyl-phosphate glucose phosphotransferase [candidate division KSB1 bacterium 4484_87]
MPKTIEKILLFLSDFLAINVTYILWVTFRLKLGFYVETELGQNIIMMFVLFLFWALLFFFFGMYRSWYAQSRFDEMVTVLKTITIGAIIIFLITFDPTVDLENPPSWSRIIIISYWFILTVLVSAGRILLRTVQRKLLENGIGRRNTLIIGWNSKSHEIYQKLKNAPALGYEVVGFICHSKKYVGEKFEKASVLGTLKDLPRLVHRYNVEVLIIAVKSATPKQVINIISRCDNLPVSLKIVPDLYDIVMGYGRTNQIYGIPLIEIMPQFMPEWEKRVKRAIDVIVSLFVIVSFLPIWILVAIAIKLDSRGPVFFKQKRVGQYEKIFQIYKFRSMKYKAEKETGPVWASEHDPRITAVGRFLRKTRIDEIPQFINILFNDMSLVGPRPERPYFVKRLKNEIPLYSRRHRMKPGITGWAQIKGGYDDSIKNVKKKLEYDLYYLENMSLRMDLKIMMRTAYTMIAGKGR